MPRDLTTNRLIYIFYTWATVLLWAGFIWWLSSVPKIRITNVDLEVLFRSAGNMLAFGFLFLLIYRASLTTFKFRVERLAFWRSEKEKGEDTEFVFIVETLLLIIAVMASIIYAIVDEYHQALVGGTLSDVRDVLLDVIGILIIALITYSVPIITETEIIAIRKLKPKKN